MKMEENTRNMRLKFLAVYSVSIVVIAFASGLVGYRWRDQMAKSTRTQVVKQEVKQVGEVPTPVALKVTDAVASPTASNTIAIRDGWKDYKISTSKYKFSVSAPENWQVIDSKIHFGVDETLLNDNWFNAMAFTVVGDSKKDVFDGDNGRVDVIVKKFGNPGDVVDSSYLNAWAGSYGINFQEYKENYKLNGMKAYEVVENKKNEPLDWGGEGEPPKAEWEYRRNIVVKANPNLYYLVRASLGNSDKNENIITTLYKIVESVRIEK